MIPSHLSLVPANSIHRAAVMALAMPSDKHKGDYPLASLFFKELLGYRRPKAHDLIVHFQRPGDIRGWRRGAYSIEAYMAAINNLLLSNGGSLNSPLKFEHKMAIFPELFQSDQSRENNRYQMYSQRDDNIRVKYQHAEKRKLESKTESLCQQLEVVEVLDGIKLLEQWLDEDVDDEVLRPACQSFFTQHQHLISSWSFNDLYHDYTTSRVILDFKLTLLELNNGER